jgi:pimeloyl-ACP methyl ester carboxylesterase
VADPVEGHRMASGQALLAQPGLGKLMGYTVGPLLAPGAVENGYAEAFFPKALAPEVVERGKLQFSRPTTLLAAALDWHLLETELPRLAGRCGELKVPVEALSSNQDRIVGPSHIKYLAEHVAGIHVERLEQAGHQVMSTHPDEVVKAVQRALDRSAP